MRRVWAERTIEAPADVVWMLLSEVDHWPSWGPSIRSATVDRGRLWDGATGTLTTLGGLTLPFEVTSFVDGETWAWDVAGIGGTDHRVHAVDERRCRAGIGVPWVVAPYVAVCEVALRRLRTLAVAHVPPASELHRPGRTP